MEQGSYMLIEPGMTVHGTDGDIGTVTEVVGDKSVDIFRGIVVAHGLLLQTQRFIVADQVTAVSDQGVQVNLTKAEAEHLPAPNTPHPDSATNTI